MADYMPFGVGTPQEVGAQEPNVLDRLIAGIIGDTVSLPERVIKATQATAPGLRREDFTDVPGAAQPGAEMRQGALEAAMLTGGATPFGMAAPRAGEVVFGSGIVRPKMPPEQFFGVTRNPREAGYITPEGKMLDLSGRHQDEFTYARMGEGFAPKPGQRDYMRDQRNVDHRELADLYPDTGSTSGGDLMRRFMSDEGMVRNQPGMGIDVIKMPTDQQLKRVVASHNSAYRGEPFRVDISHASTGDNVVSHEFARPNFESVKTWLLSYLGNK